VLHLGTGSTSSLVPILRRRALLNVKEAENGEPIRRGTVYVAAPGRHLMLEPDRVRVVPGPRENRHRPSIDVLFRSAARAFGERVIGVVLTGLLDDGAMGLRLIKEAGGMTLVQDPQDALFPSMPLAAIETGPDHVATVQRIPEILARITAAPQEEITMPRKRAHGHNPPPAGRMGADTGNGKGKPGQPSVFACPECSGVLWEVHEGDAERFECRVGHRYSFPSLVDEHSDTVERAMWIALRSLDEGAALAKRMAGRARERRHRDVAKRYEEQASEKERDAGILREILLRNSRVTPDPIEGSAPEERSA
jgi:two-component system, chemotaxis family, protein-glutamate methylesterase/glutaminase